MTSPPPQWGAPPPAAPQWGQPAQPPPQWGAPQQEQASWGAPPPPQWGAPGVTDAPGYAAPPPATASHSVVGTVFAHLVLWLGLVVVSVTSPWLVTFAYRIGSVPVEVFQGVLGAYSVLPIALALVIAGRGTTLRLAALLGGVVVVVGEVLLNVVRFTGPVYLLVGALGVAGLGTWIAVRRHAAWGYLVLVPASVFLYLWFQTDVFATVRDFPYEHGFPRPVVYLWFDLPVLALAVLGLVSSLLRPRPSPQHDGRGLAVVGALAGITVVCAVAAALL